MTAWCLDCGRPCKCLDSEPCVCTVCPYCEEYREWEKQMEDKDDA